MNEKKWEQENVLRLVKKSRKGVLRVVFSRFGLMALLLILELVLLWMISSGLRRCRASSPC